MNNVTALLALAVLPVLCRAVEIDLDQVKGVDLWGGRKAHPAVVNPVLSHDPEATISLCGEWDFTTYELEGRGELPFRNGIWGLFFKQEWKNSRKIQVPGCWEAQGVGEPGIGESWDIRFDDAVKPLRHKFTGVGWYRRSVRVPEAWSGRRIWLKLGGVKSAAWVWVNERQAAHVETLCASVKYDVTDLVKPGEDATVAVQVDNRRPSRAGEANEVNRWGGIVRAIEFEATPSEVWIDDAWVSGDFDGRMAKAQVEIEGTGREETGRRVRVTVEGERVEKEVSSSSLVLEIPLRDFRPWSSEHPNLYTATVELVGADGRVLQTRRERFGVRKLEVRGKEFFLNERPCFFRGFGDVSTYPMTGQSPADRKEHREHLAVAKASGFNFVRLHTHCEVPEYFEAADELGIMVQPELPYYSDMTTEGFLFDPVRDVTEVWRTFRRHPSFCVYSMGNEGSFGPDLDRTLHTYVKAMDPDRLKINQDCHELAMNPPEASDYVGGPITVWPRGEFDPDRPFVCHEYMNLSIKLDSRLESRFTGVWQPPVTRRERADWLAKFGLDQDWGDRLQDASHVLQRIYQKQGIECARTDPHCDGYSFWTIVDDVVANCGTYTAQGIFNPFWEPKTRGFAPKDLAMFNSSAGVFLDVRPEGRVFVSGEKVDAAVLLANYAEEEMKDATLVWTVDSEKGPLSRGQMPVGDLVCGPVRQIAGFVIDPPTVARPIKATVSLTVTMAGRTAVSNAWDCWIFPHRNLRDGSRLAIADAFMKALGGRYRNAVPEARAAEADVVIAPYDSALAAEALARGQKVVVLGKCDGAANVKLSWWFMGTQVGTAFREHPALAGLPHQGVLNELFFRIVKEGAELPLPGVRPEDLIAVGEGGDACYCYLAEQRSGKGVALKAFGLDVISPTPEGTALLDGMIDYLSEGGMGDEL